MVRYVYRDFSRTSGVFTVGFFAPGGEWEAESDHPTAEEAAGRTAWLNGVAETPKSEEEVRWREVTDFGESGQGNHKWVTDRILDLSSRRRCHSFISLHPERFIIRPLYAGDPIFPLSGRKRS